MNLRIRHRAAVIGALVLFASGGAVAIAATTTDTATCTGGTVTHTGSTSDFDVHCSVPNTEVTATVPGPTATVTVTQTVTPTPSPTPTPTPTPTSPPPPPSAAVQFGACPNAGGTSAAAAQSVVTKFGTKASIRIFHGSADPLTWTPVPAGSVAQQSFKPATTITDAQIDSLLNAARGNLITFWHEPDNDGLTATARAARIALMNRLYDRNVALGRPATVVPTFTGGFFASYGTQANRDLWADVKGDLVGLDADGVQDTNGGPTYDLTYQDEVDNVLKWITANPEYKGWTVPEFNTSRASWDTTGNIRRDWAKDQVDNVFMKAAIKPTAVMWFDYNASTTSEAMPNPSPELTYWKSLVVNN